jgi:ElaB/YqjD/DUF883 family membrane-anchored ribosome-binding protein
METKESGNHQTTQVRERLSVAMEKAKDVCQGLQDQTAAAAKATDKVVREHPYQAIAIAYGVGLLTALLVKRSRRA